MERFSASRASRLMSCPGSGNLPLAIPGWTPPEVDPSKGAKGVGSAYHKLLEQIGLMPTRDMRAMAKAIEYVAEIRSLRKFKVLAEATEEAAWLTTKPKTTVDYILYVKDEIHIFDWKTGKIPVYAQDNAQMLFYAVTFGHLAPKAKEAHLHIVQPWAANDDFDGISTYTAPVAELQEFMLEAQDTEQKLINGDTTLSPSDNCTFCPANPHSRSDKGRPLCPAQMQLLYPMRMDESAILDL